MGRLLAVVQPVLLLGPVVPQLQPTLSHPRRLPAAQLEQPLLQQAPLHARRCRWPSSSLCPPWWKACCRRWACGVGMELDSAIVMEFQAGTGFASVVPTCNTLGGLKCGQRFV